MGAKTGIEWTDSTWNPFIGCSRVSEGCRNCYAERLAGRFSAKTEGVYAGTTKAVNGLQVWTGKISRAPEETLLKPLSWKGVMVPVGPGGTIQELAPRRRRIFVNSMSDLFHENVPDEWIDQVFAVMALCPQHIFQVLTKRPERMPAWTKRNSTGGHIFHIAQQIDPKKNGAQSGRWPLPNVWLGVSVENQAAADKRIPWLLKTPTAVRFISAEPLLGPVDVSLYLRQVRMEGEVEDQKLDWVICGGESGPGARPMHPDWARSLRDQCAAAGVPFFFKQWGEWLPQLQDGAPGDPWLINASDIPERVGKKAAGALLDGREWKQFPEVQPCR